jgi:glutaredoxin
MYFEEDMSKNISTEEINYILPYENCFTIYTKSGCKFCSEVKKLLKLNKIYYKVIDCDEYLLNDKEDFLYFIKNITGQNIRTFPIVFYDAKLVGGYIETDKFIISNDMSSLIESFLDVF